MRNNWRVPTTRRNTKSNLYMGEIWWHCLRPLISLRWTPSSIQYAHLRVIFNSFLESDSSADVTLIAFRNPKKFIPGNLHSRVNRWSTLTMNVSDFSLSDTVLHWIKENVDVHSKHFKGHFRGTIYDSPPPPKRFFPNYPSCIPFAQSISDSIMDRLYGEVSVRGRVDEIELLHLVLPPTIMRWF